LHRQTGFEVCTIHYRRAFTRKALGDSAQQLCAISPATAGKSGERAFRQFGGAINIRGRSGVEYWFQLRAIGWVYCTKTPTGALGSLIAD
jgi:hypothetical protein